MLQLSKDLSPTYLVSQAREGDEFLHPGTMIIPFELNDYRGCATSLATLPTLEWFRR